VEDPEIRSRFHRAYDEVAPPAPWLAAAVGEGLRRRRATRPSGLRQELFRRPWVMAACAALLIVAMAVAVIAGSRALRRPTVPAAHGSTWCLGIDQMVPHGTITPANARPLPPAVPPGYGQECSVYFGSTDTPATLAAYYQAALTKAGWSVNTDGQIQGFVVTTWTPDAKVTGGPQPGYKPAFTGLTGDDVAAATSVLDSSGTGWLVNVRLTARGAALFTQLTTANVAACPGDPSTAQTAACPERYLAFWVRLTQNDIDHWEDSAYANGVSQPFDSAGGPQNTYPTLISDAITLEPITGGQFAIASGSRESADYLAEGFNTRLFGSHVQITFTKGHSYGVIDLVPTGTVTTVWVRVVS